MEDSLKNLEEFLSTTKYNDKLRQGLEDQKTVAAVKGIAAVIKTLRSKLTCENVVGSLKIVSIIASAVFPVIGPIPNIIVSVGCAVLGIIWKDNEQTDSTIINSIETEELKTKVRGILDKFHVSESYLCTLESKCKDVNQKDIDHMMSVIDLYQGSAILGNLKYDIENGMKLQNVVEAKRTICLINLYVRIAAIRSSMLWRMFSILTCCQKKCLGVWEMKNVEVAHTSDVIRNIIKKEDDMHKQRLLFLTEPDCNTITILTLFNPSEHIETTTFVKSLGMEFQRLTDDLQGEFSISSEKWVHYELIMSSNSWGSMWGSTTPIENQNLFRFQEVSTEDSIFTIWSVRWPSWYVHMTRDGNCRGFDKSSRVIGPQAQWKILRLKNGNFMMSPVQWPCRYAKISHYVLSRLVGCDGNPGESGKLIFEPKSELSISGIIAAWLMPIMQLG
ncbi:toxin CfTX-B-like [Mytilus edulis]|uniref:toxin CfTX-B-like n=1 Tax=Mytilus edulis TaxID=6550 RepID=UPI0039EE3832